MKILREIFKNLKNVELTKEKIKMGNMEYDKNMEINIERTTKKKYTLEQLTYFLINRDLQYTKYLRECKNNGVTSIFYSDQKIILEELEKEVETEKEAYYDLPESRYYSKHKYFWVEEIIAEKPEQIVRSKINEKYKIIVSPSLTATVNLNNIEILLSTGFLEKRKELVFDKIEFQVEDTTFVAEEDIKHWTSDDWNMLVAIFCDGSKWQINEWGIGDVASLFYNIPTFYIENETTLNKNDASKNKNKLSGYNLTRWIATDNKLKNEDFKTMWNKINEMINKKK